MKTKFVVTSIVLVTAVSWAQVKILSLSRTGTLRWTNSVTDPVASPIYRVEWASSPAGSWNRLAVVTNRTSLTVTNVSTNSTSPTFYRVAWTNGEVWRYSEYDSFISMAATGKLYASAYFATGIGAWFYSGTWSRTSARPGGLRPFIVERGKFTDGSHWGWTVDTNAFMLDFGDYGGEIGHFWLQGPWPGPLNDRWAGTWNWQGGFFPSTDSGPFVIEKVINGD